VLLFNQRSLSVEIIKEITTLLVAVYRIILPRESSSTISVGRITSIWTGLGWFENLNFAVNISLLHYFYFSLLIVGELL
jgi:hypothetical protein